MEKDDFKLPLPDYGMRFHTNLNLLSHLMFFKKKQLKTILFREAFYINGNVLNYYWIEVFFLNYYLFPTTIFEQLETVVMDIERHMNNRPLTYVESEIGENQV